MRITSKVNHHSCETLACIDSEIPDIGTTRALISRKEFARSIFRLSLILSTYPKMASSAPAKDAEAPTPIAELTIQQKRALYRKMTLAGVAKLPALPDTLEEYDIHVPVQDGWQSRTMIVRPKAGIPAKRSLIVQFYGGGKIVGDPEQLLNSARAFAETYGAVVALPSYRLCPDVRWPVPYKDGWDVLVWLSKHAEGEIGVNLDAGFIVGGVSAGASIAAVCGGLAMFPDSKEAQEAPKLAKHLTGQFLCVPGVAVEEIVPAEYRAFFTSREENSNVAGLNADRVKQVFDALQCTDYASPWFSPMTALSSQSPVNKIPVYMEHCGLDPLRDDVTVYGKLLESRSVEVKINLFAEDVHTSWTVIETTSKARNPSIKEAQMAGMKWLLSFA
jgi:acetyl esterase/lipase